jgi:hypothetical protein
VVKQIRAYDDITHIKSYDFSDLFNSINLDDTMLVMEDAYHRYELQRFVTYSKYKNLLLLVLKATYLFEGNNIYLQKIGIPMGGSCSSVIADIFLHHYEIKNCFINEILYFRYVDDVLVVFRDTEHIIDLSFYPSYLKLIETPHNTDSSINFLDLNLNTINGHVIYKIFDKRDSYNFPINKAVRWHSAVHKNIFRNIINNHVLRCIRLNSKQTNIFLNITDFTYNLQFKYNYPKPFINSTISRFKEIFDYSS